MARRKLWFGTPGHAKPIKMPQGGGTHAPIGASESVQYLSGRKAIRRSLGFHMEYDWTFLGQRYELEHLIDCAAGVYGPPPFYFIDPMWEWHNVLPAHWATPSMGVYDSPPIYGEARPQASPGSANDGSWPAEAATFTRQASADEVTVYIPIPPAQTFHFWYAGDSDAVRIIRMTGSSRGVSSAPTPANPTLPLVTQAHTTVRNNGSIDGVLIKLNVPAGSPKTVFGMRAIITPSTTLPSSGVPRGFVGGRGHSGVDFDQPPVPTPYSVPYDSIGMTVKLVEVDY